MFLNLSQIKRQSPKDFCANLKSSDATVGLSAAKAISDDATRYGISLRDYFNASIEVPAELVALGITSGYEAALVELNIPVKNDFANHVSMLAAADTFATQPGTRLLFPEVVMDMIKWKTGELDQFISVKPLIAQTRTVQGTNELINIELDDTGVDLSMNTVAEGANIPMVNITQSQRAVKFYKVGKGYRFTYEFARRASIDILTPFVNRMNRTFEIDKVTHATSILINGDNVAGAVTADAETAYGGTNGVLDFKSFMKWLMARMAAGYPVETLAMNYATYADFLGLFTPTLGQTSEIESLGAKAGISVAAVNLLGNLKLKPVIAPNVGASTILGINQAETLEELVEAGSDITENQRIIRNQHVEFVRTINIGYNLTSPNSRRSFVYAS